MDTKKIVRAFLIEELRDTGFHENVHNDQSLIDTGIMDSFMKKKNPKGPAKFQRNLPLMFLFLPETLRKKYSCTWM